MRSVKSAFYGFVVGVMFRSIPFATNRYAVAGDCLIGVLMLALIVKAAREEWE